MMRRRDMRPGFMRDHMWTRRHLREYLDGGLDDRAHARVEHHAGLCPKCHEMIAALKRTLEGLRALRDRPPRDSAGGVAESVIGRLRDSA
jgi:anti-sigma factor RsiW